MVLWGCHTRGFKPYLCENIDSWAPFRLWFETCWGGAGSGGGSRPKVWLLSILGRLMLLAQLGFQYRYHSSTPMFPKFWVQMNHLSVHRPINGGLCWNIDSDSVGPMGPAFCISNKFPDYWNCLFGDPLEKQGCRQRRIWQMITSMLQPHAAHHLFLHIVLLGHSHAHSIAHCLCQLLHCDRVE